MKTKTDLRSVFAFMDKFRTEKACRNYLENLRWPNGIYYCPRCGSDKTIKFATGKGYNCNACRKPFSLTKGTIFERSHISLTKWFYALHLCINARQGVSSITLSKELGITQPNAWRMEHRIRYAMRNCTLMKLEGIIELDETYVGGRNHNRHKDKKVPHSQGRSTADKTPVFGIMQRDGRKVCTFTLNNVRGKVLKLFTKVRVKRGSTVMTDEYPAYRGLQRLGYNHKRCNHKLGQYVVDGAHTNTLEGFWSSLKNGIRSTYHNVSRKYLSFYAKEYEFKYNAKSDSFNETFDRLLSQFFGKSLPAFKLTNR